MTTVKTDLQAEQLIITLDRGRANPINAQLVHDLRQVFRDLSLDENIKGAILTGKRDFFSVGLDVVELYDYDEEAMAQFWQDFSALIYEMVACPKPVVAAITGHSPAGGCVLALCCDYRVMATGKYTIGLNEVPVGIVVPRNIYHLYSHVIGEGLAYQALMDGRLFQAEEAQKIHLVDEAVAPDQVSERAQTKLLQYFEMNPTAWQLSKKTLRDPLLKRLDEDFETVFSDTLTHWWNPGFRQELQEMIKRLKP